MFPPPNRFRLKIAVWWGSLFYEYIYVLSVLQKFISVWESARLARYVYDKSKNVPTNFQTLQIVTHVYWLTSEAEEEFAGSVYWELGGSRNHNQL